MKQALEIFEKHWQKKTGQPLDNATLQYMQYAVEAVNEALNLNKKYGPRHHDLKITPDFFTLQVNKIKTFELRYNDRDFKAGDTVSLHCFLPKTQKFTGESLHFQIAFVLKDYPGLVKGFCILQLTEINLKRPGASAAKQ